MFRRHPCKKIFKKSGPVGGIKVLKLFIVSKSNSVKNAHSVPSKEGLRAALIAARSPFGLKSFFRSVEFIAKAKFTIRSTMLLEKIFCQERDASSFVWS